MPRTRSAGAQPLAATLDALAPFVPTALVSPEALAAIVRAAGRLPAQLADELYLECRLAAGAPRVDLVLHVRDEGRGVLAGTHPGAALPPALLRRPAWRRLRRFCAEWADPGSAAHAAPGGMWLELDVEGPAPERAPPGVFLDLRPLAARGASAAECHALAAEWLDRLGGRPPPPETLASLHRCLRALPPGGSAAYVGLFPGRGGVVRCCVRGMAAGALPAYLAAAGWEGDRAALEMITDGPLRGAPLSIVHLDLDGGHRLGVELALERRGQLAGGAREAAAPAEELAELGLAAPEKAAALAEWPGWTEEVMPHQPWPSVLARRVNHLKLVLQAGRDPEAKAYLWARHTHRRRAEPNREETMQERIAASERAHRAPALADPDELDDDALEQAAGGLARAWVGEDTQIVAAPAPPAP